MRTPLVYLDTSVIGGYFDAEFRDATVQFVDCCRSGHFRPVISDLVTNELEGAPEEVQFLLSSPDWPSSQFVRESDESRALTDAYLNASVLGPRHLDDCRHVALASVTGTDLLVSWNFRHIVQYDRIRAFNAVNLQAGYRMIEIRSPLEVIYHG